VHRAAGVEADGDADVVRGGAVGEARAARTRGRRGGFPYPRLVHPTTQRVRARSGAAAHALRAALADPIRCDLRRRLRRSGSRADSARIAAAGVLFRADYALVGRADCAVPATCVQASGNVIDPTY